MDLYINFLLLSVMCAIKWLEEQIKMLSVCNMRFAYLSLQSNKTTLKETLVGDTLKYSRWQ
jgi:hypothetical protein